jgi:hypothetical protein
MDAFAYAEVCRDIGHALGIDMEGLHTGTSVDGEWIGLLYDDDLGETAEHYVALPRRSFRDAEIMQAEHYIKGLGSKLDEAQKNEFARRAMTLLRPRARPMSAAHCAPALEQKKMA